MFAAARESNSDDVPISVDPETQIRLDALLEAAGKTVLSVLYSKGHF